jgi:hypothetical protein
LPFGVKKHWLSANVQLEAFPEIFMVFRDPVRGLVMGAVGLAFLALSGCATLGKPLPPPPTTTEIVQMAKDGRSADEIIGRMKESRAVYRLPASELAKLREQGVPDAVIDYMQQTYIEAERYEEYRRARDFYWGYAWPAPYWPHPPYRYRFWPYYW